MMSTGSFIAQDHLLEVDYDSDKEREAYLIKEEDSSSMSQDSNLADGCDEVHQAMKKHKQTVINQEQLAMAYVT